MDRRGKQARHHHEEATRAESEAQRQRQERDVLVRSLSHDGFGYDTIARMVGCSKSLVRLIVRSDVEQ